MNVEVLGRTIEIGKTSETSARRWRKELSPEPETVNWINNLKPGVFFDIGASCGIHTVRAAVAGHRVYAFEPENDSYNDLERVLELNMLWNVMAYQMALSNERATGCLSPGRSAFTFYHGGEGGQPAVAWTLEQVCEEFDVWPNYIKIDVDGNELQILQGAHKVLSNRKLKSLLIEIDPGVPGDDTIPGMLNDYGFTYDQVQVDACKVGADEYDGKYTGLANYIFWRK